VAEEVTRNMEPLIELRMVRDGIEPPTRGFSGRQPISHQ
jgi:hypothetical protein